MVSTEKVFYKEDTLVSKSAISSKAARNTVKNPLGPSSKPAKADAEKYLQIH
jgi:hypothetical protein